MAGEMYRQGDVLLLKRDRRPPGRLADYDLVERDNGRIVLAYGEATGHAHAIADDSAKLIEAKRGARRFLSVPGSETVLRHEEHDAIHLPPGIYEVVQQREYSPAGDLLVGD